MNLWVQQDDSITRLFKDNANAKDFVLGIQQD
jgi:hypothetical protein